MHLFDSAVNTVMCSYVLCNVEIQLHEALVH